MAVPIRVLIVEDSVPDALLLLRELGHAGFEPESERVDTADDMPLRWRSSRGTWSSQTT